MARHFNSSGDVTSKKSSLADFKVIETAPVDKEKVDSEWVLIWDKIASAIDKIEDDLVKNKLKMVLSLIKTTFENSSDKATLVSGVISIVERVGSLKNGIKIISKMLPHEVTNSMLYKALGAFL